VIFSHSSVAAVTEHVRNVPDDVLRRLARNGGVVMVTFVPRFVSNEVFAHDVAEEAEKALLGARHPGQKDKVAELLEEWRARHPAPRATLAQVADHIAHAVRVAGVDHVGLGSDFDGMRGLPEGLEDVSRFPGLLDELLRRGFSEVAVKKIAGLNALRVMHTVEVVAARLQKERGPSELRFEATAARPQSR
jgi:membrane dipeptidase